MGQHETGTLHVSEPKPILFPDVPEPLASEAVSHLLTQSRSALVSPSPPPAWPDPVYDGRRAYIRTSKDDAIPPIAQEMMLKYSGVEWVVKELNTAHSPFLSHPEELFDVLLRLTKDFATISS